MKVEFKTSKGKFFFYLDNNILNLENSIHGVYAEYKSGNVLPLFKNCEFIGFTKDLTEEQWGEVVDWGSYLNTYKNYITNDNHKSNQCSSATESGKSLMDSLGVYLENPYADKDGYPNSKVCPIYQNDQTGEWQFVDGGMQGLFDICKEKTGSWLLIKYL